MRRFLHMLLATLLLVAMTSFPFIMPVQQAYAAGAPSWQLVDTKTITGVYKDNDAYFTSNGFSLTETTSSSATYTCSYMAVTTPVSFTSEVEWSDPPKTIPIGQEDKAVINLTLAITNVEPAVTGSDLHTGGHWTSASKAGVRVEWGPIDGKAKMGYNKDSKFTFMGGQTFPIGAYEWAGYARFKDVAFRATNIANDGSWDYSGYNSTTVQNNVVSFCAPNADARTFPMKVDVTEAKTTDITKNNCQYYDSADHDAYGLVIYVHVPEAGVTRAWFYEYKVGSTATPSTTVETTATREKGEQSEKTTIPGWVIPAVVGVLVVVGGSTLLSRGGQKEPEPSGGNKSGKKSKKSKSALSKTSPHTRRTTQPNKGSQPSSQQHGQQPPAQQPQQRQEQEQPSTYRMVLWKDFGDTLYVGGTTQLVGARIEEQTARGEIKDRPDLTAQITFGTSENLAGKAIGMKDRCQCCEVQAISAGGFTGIVAITFAGEGGTFTNNVKFKVEELRLVFPDWPLTFVAGEHATYEMPFKFNDEDIAKLSTPKFDAHFPAPETEALFSGLRVVRDPDFPDEMFGVELTENGKADDNDPGSMLHYTCEVTATFPARTADGKEIKVTDTFNFFRFYEGLRFSVEPLKCYYVPYEEKEKDIIVHGDELSEHVPDPFAATVASASGMNIPGLSGQIDASIQESVYQFDLENEVRRAERESRELRVDGDQLARGVAGTYASAIGGVGGMTVPTLDWQIELGIRETARELDKRFPEIFSADSSYLFDKRDKIRFTPGRTHAYATLFVVEEFKDKRGRTYKRPVTPLPNAGDFHISFEDVEGSSVLLDKEGKPLVHPCNELDFEYFIKDVQRTDNTVVFEILPTKGVLVPPNRSQVTVSCLVTWKGRRFTQSNIVNAISQPYRLDIDEKLKEYTAGDDEITSMLRMIQRRILGCEKLKGGLAVKGSVSVGETLMDVIEEDLDHWYLLLNPITIPGLALYNAYVVERSVERQRNVEIYYDDLTPMYNLIETQIQGHDYEFGYYMPIINNIVTTFARFEVGELGSAEAIDLAGRGFDMVYEDTLRMTVQDWNHSWTAIGVRIGCALVTGGQSEWLFIPISSITTGMEASINYIDYGGDSLLEAYRVGCDIGGKHLLKETAITATVEVGMMAVGTCIKAGKVLFQETAEQRQLFMKVLKKLFTSGKYSKQVQEATKRVANQLDDAAREAEEVIKLVSGEANVGAKLERQISYTLGRVEGQCKVKILQEVVQKGKYLTTAEKRTLATAIQGDKHAMNMLIDLAKTGKDGEAVAAFFNETMQTLEKKALDQTVEALAQHFKIPKERIRVNTTSGNAAADIAAGKKVPMDMDATFQYYDKELGKFIDIKSGIAQEYFDAAFYRLAKGSAANNQATARAFARQMDMTITDLFHPEAYSPHYDDVMKIIDASRAGEPYRFAKTVAEVARYKCTHWLGLAKEAAAKAREFKALGAIDDAYKCASASEAFAEEAARQFTKQVDRMIVPKIVALEARGISLAGRTSVSINQFLAKASVLSRSGLGRFGGRGLTSAEVDVVLEKGFKSSADLLYSELETLVKELDNLLIAADNAAKSL